MSYVPGSDSRDLWLVLGGIAALVGSLQWRSTRESKFPGRIVSRCADGSLVGEWGFGARRRPPPGRGLRFGWRDGLRIPWPAAVTSVREDLEPGDLSFLRIRPGGSDESAWMVEGLDPGPGTFRVSWAFDSPDSALAAFRLLEARVARPPRDAEGRAVTLTDREFDALWSSDEAVVPPTLQPSARAGA